LISLSLNKGNVYFSQLLDVHRTSDVRQIEIHRSEPLVSDHSTPVVEIAIAKLKRYKSPSSDQISTEFIKKEVKYYSLKSIS
jgi:hypothetical protein